MNRKLFIFLLISIIGICIYPITSNAGFLRTMFILGEMDRMNNNLENIHNKNIQMNGSSNNLKNYIGDKLHWIDSDYDNIFDTRPCSVDIEKSDCSGLAGIITAGMTVMLLLMFSMGRS